MTKAKSMMVMGTASDVGKSVVVTALCRVAAQAGVRVAPFKSQNISNNSAVCRGGGEIGRAQAVQAEACGIDPMVEMNPVLLKPESAAGCQVVVSGRARFQIAAGDHGNDHYRRTVWPEIAGSYARLAASSDAIIIEGAGGAAEVNLRDRDLANWAVAELADAPVLIVADIDKGGALAAMVGTIELLSPSERRRVRGFVINKFRGDPGLLEDGLRVVERKTGIPVLGVIPWTASTFDIPQEDSASLRIEPAAARHGQPIRVGVIHFPCISNYTDFAPLRHEPEVELQYIQDPEQAGDLDLLCLPGSKSTIADLNWMRATQWDRRIFEHHRAGGSILGVCAGYQILGRSIADPMHVESPNERAAGLGMLDVETIFEREKITAPCSASHIDSGSKVEGYEIHCGRIKSFCRSAPFMVVERDGSSVNESEGAVSDDGRVLGTSIHGLFDAPGFRRHFVNHLRVRRGLPALAAAPSSDARTARLRAYDNLADLIRNNLDLSAIAEMLGLESLERFGR